MTRQTLGDEMKSSFSVIQHGLSDMNKNVVKLEGSIASLQSMIHDLWQEYRRKNQASKSSMDSPSTGHNVEQLVDNKSQTTKEAAVTVPEDDEGEEEDEQGAHGEGQNEEEADEDREEKDARSLKKHVESTLAKEFVGFGVGEGKDYGGVGGGDGGNKDSGGDYGGDRSYEEMLKSVEAFETISSQFLETTDMEADDDLDQDVDVAKARDEEGADGGENDIPEDALAVNGDDGRVVDDELGADDDDTEGEGKDEEAADEEREAKEVRPLQKHAQITFEEFGSFGDVSGEERGDQAEEEKEATRILTEATHARKRVAKIYLFFYSYGLFGVGTGVYLLSVLDGHTCPSAVEDIAELIYNNVEEEWVAVGVG